MVLLPVVERELRVAARGRALYRMRFWAALVMTGVLAWMVYSLPQGYPVSQMGLEVLSFLSLWAFIFSALIGVVATSDCVSREKREGTMGLLFLTDLKGYDVICGKLAANSINALYSLVAIMPVLGIPLLFGGVTFEQFAKLALALLTIMVFSLSVGIFVSTFSWSERKAMIFTVLILLVATLTPPLLTALADFRGSASDIWLLLAWSPGFGVLDVFVDKQFPAYAYWVWFAWLWVASTGLVAISSEHAPNSWEEKTPKAALSKPAPKMSVRAKKAGVRAKQWLEKNPYVWLALRGEASPRRVWFFVLSIFALWLIGAWALGSLAFDRDAIYFFILCLHTPLLIWVPAEASRRFVEDRNNSTFEFLLSTPLTERQIVDGQWIALWKQFGWPVLAVIALEFFCVLHGTYPDNYAYWGAANKYSVMWPLIAGAFSFAADCLALAWVGMWLGCVSKSRGRAILGSLGLVVVAPWLISIVTSSFDSRATYHLCHGVVLALVGFFIIRPYLINRLRGIATTG